MPSMILLNQMKKQKIIFFLLFVIVAIGGLIISGVQANDTASRKIVIFQAGVTDTAKDNIIGKAGGAKLKDLDLVRGKAVWLSNKAAEKLAKQPGVLRVEDDIVVQALENFNSEKVTGKAKTPFQPSQVLPWGIDKIDAEKVWASSTADLINVGIIDTGISNNHPDLLANVKGGINTIQPRKSWNDDNGHGSHVAGIVGALNNSVGVVGAGPAINLYAIKVLNSSGSGFVSDIIEGLQWAINNNMQVVNLSLGASTGNQSFHDAIIATKNAGIVVVAAAGNSGGSVIYPAAYPEAIAVSAIDISNTIASWSSRGPEVDLAAPGVSIYSSYKGTAYATLSGTSMASPHVAGAAALVLSMPVGSSDTNNNGNWDPDEVQTKLQATAVDLGDVGFDNLYGAGLVNAFAATRP